MTGSTPTISVVIPAYKAGGTIQRLIDSLDAQTLPQDRFETIVVDDGSPDDTFDRLNGLAATRPNLHVERIAPSGWASRPRNVGADLARGEYILFMDADDTLFPDALRRSVEFALANDSDVLSPKESKTNAPWWGMERWSANRANVKADGTGIGGLMPMMPHKIYRRAFLLEHNIRFPETAAGHRVLWEDIWFNIEAYRHARVVSVLSDTPVYLWHQNAGSISKSYSPRDQEFWSQLENLFAYIVTELADDPDARDVMLRHQYGGRVLFRLSRIIRDLAPRELAMALGRAQALRAAYVSDELEGSLDAMVRARSVLLRQGRADLMADLWELDRNTRMRAEVRAVRWIDGALVVSVDTTWASRSGVPVPFVRRGDRVLRAMPAALESAIDASVLDVTDELAALSMEVWVRSRYSKVTWAVPTESTRAFVAGSDGTLRLSVISEAVIDPESAGFGRPLGDSVWDVWAETHWLGTFARGGVLSSRPSVAALTSGRPGVAYRNRHHELTLDIAQALRGLVQDGRPAIDRATVTAGSFSIPLPGLTVVGSGTVPITLHLQPSNDRLRRAIDQRRIPSRIAARLTAVIDGAIIADDEAARLEAPIPARPGRYRLAVASARGDLVATTITFSVLPGGRMRFAAVPVDRAGSAVADVRKRLRGARRDAERAARGVARRIRSRIRSRISAGR